MIGHCLRFWPAYEYAKELIDSKKYGDVIEAYFSEVEIPQNGLIKTGTYKKIKVVVYY